MTINDTSLQKTTLQQKLKTTAIWRSPSNVTVVFVEVVLHRDPSFEGLLLTPHLDWKWMSPSDLSSSPNASVRSNVSARSLESWEAWESTVVAAKASGHLVLLAAAQASVQLQLRRNRRRLLAQPRRLQSNPAGTPLVARDGPRQSSSLDPLRPQCSEESWMYLESRYFLLTSEKRIPQRKVLWTSMARVANSKWSCPVLLARVEARTMTMPIPWPCPIVLPDPLQPNPGAFFQTRSYLKSHPSLKTSRIKVNNPREDGSRRGRHWTQIGELDVVEDVW